MKLRLILVLLPSAYAFQIQFPFKISKLFSSESIALNAFVTESPPVDTTPRIAIVGAGAGGSSAAFWISKAKERFGLDVEVDVYDSNDYIGGRSTIVYPYNDSSLPELELGASIFVNANKNLWRASDEFNFTRKDFEEEDTETAIWDGEQLLVSFSGSWWDTAKVLWRYGILSPRRTESYVRSMIDQFLTLYTAATPKWDNIGDLAGRLGWTDMASNSTLDYLLKQGVSEKYIKEVVEAATRVNYGQDTDHIHALEGACSMAATGATGIKGGNFLIFEQFLNRSGANVYLKTPVSQIMPKSPESHLWSVKSSRGVIDYKAIILAAPFHSTGITVPLALSEQIPPQPYVHLHVTLLATTSPTPNPEYFGLSATSAAPRMILTTNQTARAGGAKPEFNSLSYHGLVREGEWAVKIFSQEEITDEWLDHMFRGQVGWVLRKQWDAYPKLPPTTEFPSVKLDRGFYYVNSFEPFISTMETETISARNVVDLLLNDEFGTSICGQTISKTPDQLPDEQESLDVPTSGIQDAPDFVWGWDC